MTTSLPHGSFFDLFPVSVFTTSTLNQLAEHQPESRFDPRRFRMNILVDIAEKGIVENGWLGRRLTIGDRATVVAMVPDPRCVMTTLAQDDLPRDNAILQTAARHNRLDVAGAGHYPCVGVYAVVSTTGVIRSRDPVTLA